MIAVVLVFRQRIVEQLLFAFGRSGAVQEVLFLQFAEALVDLPVMGIEDLGTGT